MESPLSQYFAGLLSQRAPTKWTQRYRDEILTRARRRINDLGDRLDGVTQGRAIPDVEQVTIGSGRQLRLAVLFLDVCGFSQWPNWTTDEQKRVLAIMNTFMAEMLNVIRDFGGVYEKNTGDGLMAYFGEGASSDADRVKPAVEAAVTMHYINDAYLTPYFNQSEVLVRDGITPIRFRVGIDVGPVTLARVGIPGKQNSIVAIGTTANVACKLMNLIPNGGICVGQSTYQHLPNNWGWSCSPSQSGTGFVYVASGAPYPAWTVTYRLSEPNT